MLEGDFSYQMYGSHREGAPSKCRKQHKFPIIDHYLILFIYAHFPRCMSHSRGCYIYTRHLREGRKTMIHFLRRIRYWATMDGEEDSSREILHGRFGVFLNVRLILGCRLRDVVKSVFRRHMEFLVGKKTKPYIVRSWGSWQNEGGKTLCTNLYKSVEVEEGRRARTDRKKSGEEMCVTCWHDSPHVSALFDTQGKHILLPSYCISWNAPFRSKWCVFNKFPGKFSFAIEHETFRFSMDTDKSTN